MVGKRKGLGVKNRKDCRRPVPPPLFFIYFKLLSLNIIVSKPTGINNHGNNFGITQTTLKACSKHSCEKTDSKNYVLLGEWKPMHKLCDLRINELHSLGQEFLMKC